LLSLRPLRDAQDQGNQEKNAGNFSEPSHGAGK
jgi:hypothetical protein